MNAKVLAERIRALLIPVHGDRLRSVVLYGSVARGNAAPDSDVDVLVILDEVSDYARDLRANIEALYPLTTEIGRRISAKPTSEKDYRDAACPLFRNAHREGIAA